MFIVITGLDGSGTSTVAEKIAKKDKDAIILKTPSIHYQGRDIIDEDVRKYSPIGHFLYYLSSTVFMSDYIKATIDYKTKNVYCVRYLIDTFVSNKVAGLPLELNYNILGNQLLEPDLTVFVYVDEEERQRRITKRGKSELDKVLDDEQKRQAFLSEFSNSLDSKKTYMLCNKKDGIDEEINKLYEYIKEKQIKEG